MSETDVKSQVREFVLEIAQRKGVAAVADDDSITENGIIDSLAIFRLVSFLEDNFQVRVGDDEIINDNFQSINDIERFVLVKQGKAPATA